jgi:hypothetical protein
LQIDEWIRKLKIKIRLSSHKKEPPGWLRAINESWCRLCSIKDESSEISEEEIEILLQEKVTFFEYSDGTVSMWPCFGVIGNLWNIAQSPDTSRSYEFVAGGKLSCSGSREAVCNSSQGRSSFAESALEFLTHLCWGKKFDPRSDVIYMLLNMFWNMVANRWSMYGLSIYSLEDEWHLSHAGVMWPRGLCS